MSAIDPKILSKIKKCLALGASPNPHEAAVAMSQAQALMRKHGVDSAQVAMAEVGEAETASRTMSRDKPAHWELRLAAAVGKAFGCQMLLSRLLHPKCARRHVNEGSFVFIGQKAQAEVAAYTLEVLARKCKVARQKWIAEKLAGLSELRGGRTKATRLGDAFAEGWVNSIGQLVTDFANSHEVETAIKQRMEEKKTSENCAPSRDIKEDSIGLDERIAARFGQLAARCESLYRPMGTEAPRVAIGMEGVAA